MEKHNPYEEILAKECLNWFKHSRVVAFLHLNPIKSTQKFPVVQDLKIEHFHIRRYGKKVIQKALVGTAYEPCLSLYVSHNEIIFSEQNKVDVLLKILKKAPQLILLGKFFLFWILLLQFSLYIKRNVCVLCASALNSKTSECISV